MTIAQTNYFTPLFFIAIFCFLEYLCPGSCSSCVDTAYVRIEKKYSYRISFGEIQVYSSTGTNVALGKSASQSTTLSTYDAQQCVDNNLNMMSDVSVCITQDVKDGWWEVDLAGVHCIDRIVTYNYCIGQSVCSPNRMTSVSINLLSSTRATVHSWAAREEDVAVYHVDERAAATSATIVQVHSGYWDYLTFSELELFSDGVNVALNKPATQSSTLDSNPVYGASVGVDGNSDDPNTIHTHLAGTRDQWWEVNLGAPTQIDTIVLHNRQQVLSRTIACSILFMDASHNVLRSFPLSGKSIEFFNTTYDPPTCVPARYLKLHHGDYNKWITLREILVYDLNGDNVAFGKYATMTAATSWPVTNCLDGSTTTYADINLGICGVQGSNAGIEIDFGAEYCIDRVIIYNRGSTDTYEVDAAHIRLMLLGGATTNHTVYATELTSDIVQSYQVSQTNRRVLNGVRTVRIENIANIRIALREVMAISGNENVAYLKSATQSSTLSPYEASIAVDGNSSLEASNGISVTNSELNSYWQVDLGGDYCLDGLTVFNRADMENSYLSKAVALLLNSAGDVLHVAPLSADLKISHYFNHNESHTCTAPASNCIKAKYLMIESYANDYLSMQEVEVITRGSNVAYRRFASMTNIPPASGDTYSAWRCGDGETYAKISGGHCATDTADPRNYFLVLDEEVCAESVILFIPSTDPYAQTIMDRPMHWNISVFDSTVTRTWSQDPIGTGTIFVLTFSQDNFPTTSASRVRIQHVYNQYLCVKEVEVYSNGVNIARGVPVSKRSLFSASFPAENMVDGQRDSVSTGCCTTQTQEAAFEFDVSDAAGYERNIDSIALYNWLNQPERLTYAELILLNRLGHPTRSFILKKSAVQIINLTQNVFGVNRDSLPHCAMTRYVRVQSRGDTGNVMMREVEVYSQGRNVALLKPAFVEPWSAIHTDQNKGPLCVDGNIVQETINAVCYSLAGGYFEVDLLSEHCVESVVIYNRVDQDQSWLAGASVVLLNASNNPVAAWDIIGEQVELFRIGSHSSEDIKYVRILQSVSLSVMLRELELYDNRGYNVALNQAATQSSTFYDAVYQGYYYASLAFDGITSVAQFYGHCQQNQAYGNWMEVELLFPTCLRSARIFSREDYPTWLNGAVAILMNASRVPRQIITLTTTSQLDFTVSFANYCPTPSSTITPSASANETNTTSSTLSKHSFTDSISQNASKSFSLSETLSHSPPLTTSASKSLSSSAVPSISATYSLTPPLTSSASLSPTVTPPPTPTRTLTSTVTLSLSHTQSPTITPPPTPTLTGTFTATETFTQSVTTTSTVSSTITLPITMTLSMTHSVPLTQTLTHPLTPTAEVTATESLEVFCGGLLRDECLSLAGICNLTSEGLCFRSNCSNLFSELRCVRNGCNWQQKNISGNETNNSNSNGTCGKPLDCKDYLTKEECFMNQYCRWSDDQCRPDATPCHTLKTSTDCIAAGCSFNSDEDPPCFKPIFSSTLCPLIKTPTMCSIQSCLWLQPTGKCERWDVSCTKMFPSITTCPMLERCVYSPTSRSCANIEAMNFSDFMFPYLVGAEHPSSQIPGDPFDVTVFGTPLSENASLGFVPLLSSVSQKRISVASFFADSKVQFPPNYYDKKLKGSKFLDVVVDTPGNFSLFVKVNETYVFGPLGVLQARLVIPNLEECRLEPEEPYLGQTFAIHIVGTGMDSLGRYRVTNATSCPEFDNQSYVPIALHGREESIAYHTATNPGNFTLCYANRGNVPAPCPSSTSIFRAPPWFDMATLQEIAETLPYIRGLSVIDFNMKSCKSMVMINKTGGVFSHPLRMKLELGDGSSPYLEASVCIFAVSLYNPDPEVRAIMVDFWYILLNSGDELRVFVSDAPDDNSKWITMHCASINNKAACVQHGCTWTGTCELVMGDIADCPTAMNGYVLRRVLTHQSFQGEEDVSIPFSASGIIFAACSAPGVKTGLGVSLSYRTQSTYCPNDCKDEHGTKRGSCSQDVATGLWSCRCNDGFVGLDCSRQASCTGTGPRAQTLKVAEFKQTFQMKNEPCAFLLEADPSASSVLPDVKKHTIGLSIRKMKLSDADCDKSYILLRSGSHNGRLLKRLCKNDEIRQDPEDFFRALVNRSSASKSAVYMEFSSQLGDYFEVEAKIVSVQCPGINGVSGYPQKQEEICNGKGSCVPTADYMNRTTLSPYAFQCLCHGVYASNVIGGTCDTCAFGYKKDTFPVCEPATICALNCTGKGDCIKGIGCLCNAGYYGLDCELEDDGNRMGHGDVLKIRSPLNVGKAGNVISSGNIDRSIIPCALPGSRFPCHLEKRRIGKQYTSRQRNTGGFLSNNNPNTQDGVRKNRRSTKRRSFLSTAANTSDIGFSLNNETVLADSNATEAGLIFNELVTGGKYPDYLRIDNTSSRIIEFHGDITIAAWVKVSGSAQGFLVAKVDSAFYADGRSPALEKAFVDIQDRSIPLENMKLRSEPLNVHFALLLNGPQKRVDLMITDPQKRNTSSKEKWAFVRHFRMGKKAGDLFDGTWRYFSLRLLKIDNRIEAQVFIDGESRLDHRFVQCVPFVPPALQQSNKTHFTTDPQIAFNQPGTSVFFGYRLTGALNQLQIYSASLSENSLASIGSDDFLGSTRIPHQAAIAIFAISAIGLAFALCLMMLRGIAMMVKGGGQTSDATSDETKLEEEEEEEQKEECEGAAESPQESARSPAAGELDPPDTHKNELATAVSVSGVGLGLSMMSDRSLHPAAVPDSDEDNEAFSSATLNNSPRSKLKTDNNNQLQHDENAGDDYASNERRPSHDEVERLQDENPLAGQTEDDWRTRKNVELLKDIHGLIAASKKLCKEAVLVQDDNRSQEELADAVVLLVGTYQMTGSYASTSSMPKDWKGIFGSFFLIVSLNFFPAANIPLAAVYLTLAILSLISMGAFSILFLLTHAKSQKEIEDALELTREAVKQAIAEGESYKPTIPKVERLSRVLLTILQILYVPVTQQSIAIVFCHRLVMCYYDCYNEQEHVSLVIVGCIVLSTITLLLPILAGYVVARSTSQYRAFLGKFDNSEEFKQLEKEHWEEFYEAQCDPFQKLFQAYKYQWRYSQCLDYIYRTLFSFATMALTAESVEQFTLVVLIQLIWVLFSAASRPCTSEFTNVCLDVGNLFLLTMMFLQCAFIMTDNSATFGALMITITVLFCVFTIVVISYRIVKLVKSLKKKSSSDDEKETESQPDDDVDNKTEQVGGNAVKDEDSKKQDDSEKEANSSAIQID